MVVPQLETQKEFEDRFREKLEGVRTKGYITCGTEVKSLTDFFPVAKTWKESGDFKVVDKIGIVYDATKSYLNKFVYTPWFPMPTVDLHLRAVEECTYIADCNVGGIFLNFMIEPSLRPHTGVDLTHHSPK